MLEIRWHGRGGQGTKTAVLLLAESVVTEGGYAQGFSEYGPERMGAPVAGKSRMHKDLTEIMIAHDLPYVAQACISHWKDCIHKVEKAVHTEGPTFINVLAPCTLGWKFPPEQGLEIAKLAVGELAGTVWREKGRGKQVRRRRHLSSSVTGQQLGCGRRGQMTSKG